MQTTVDFFGRPLRVELSSAAEAAVHRRAEPLHVEMELYFSCLIRKRVRFELPARGERVSLGERLTLSFRPVMSRGCTISDYDPDALEDLPIVEPARFVPHWLKLDFRDGAWQGEYGY